MQAHLGLSTEPSRARGFLWGEFWGPENSVSISIFLPHYGKKGEITGMWGLELKHWFLVQIPDLLE